MHWYVVLLQISLVHLLPLFAHRCEYDPTACEGAFADICISSTTPLAPYDIILLASIDIKDSVSCCLAESHAWNNLLICSDSATMKLSPRVFAIHMRLR